MDSENTINQCGVHGLSQFSKYCVCYPILAEVPAHSFNEVRQL